MHPFGGIPICPRCSKQVYAAEQVMGPGRKLYHKVDDMLRSKDYELTSVPSLVLPSMINCKSCHIKNFGTRDLRHANLPHKEDLPSSPTKATQPPLPLPPRVTSPTRADPPAPLLKPTRSLASPTGIRSPTFPRNSRDTERTNDKDHETETAASSTHGHTPPLIAPPASSPSGSPSGKPGTPSNSGRHGQENFPRTVPLSPTAQPLPIPEPNQSPTSPAPASRPVHHSSRSVESVLPAAGIVPTSTGTRYGALLNRPAANALAGVNLTGNTTSSPRRWGGDTPTCPRCGKNVYFAEQVKAVGKTYHKGCLRCLECKTLLDSSRLRDHDGEPYCMRCHGKLHGPRGNGYALLGKAGG
ncbi:hypothetical protein AX15_007761 [Amanita polypyramis BW_CC]|nr:hypothetical protein AX15_007761 [Amanita polypyramis BW_CC]